MILVRFWFEVPTQTRGYNHRNFKSTAPTTIRMSGTDRKQSGDHAFNQGHCRILRIELRRIDVFADGARALGRALGKAGITIVCGGTTRGLMGVVAMQRWPRAVTYMA